MTTLSSGRTLPGLKDTVIVPSRSSPVGGHIPANGVQVGEMRCVQRSTTDIHSGEPFLFLNLDPDI